MRRKSAVAPPWERKFLGFSFTPAEQPKRRIASQALERFKQRVGELTRRNQGRSLGEVIEHLARYLRGWRGYFGFCETPTVLRDLDSWIRHRLRSLVWKQWKRGTRRYSELRARGIHPRLAAQTAGSAHGPWRLAHSQALHQALPTSLFIRLGLPSLHVPRPA